MWPWNASYDADHYRLISIACMLNRLRRLSVAPVEKLPDGIEHHARVIIVEKRHQLCHGVVSVFTGKRSQIDRRLPLCIGARHETLISFCGSMQVH
jgi:hypothetical protein